VSEPSKTAAGLAVLLATLAAAMAVAWAGGERSPVRWQAILLAAGTAGSGSVAAWLVARWSRSRTAATAVAGGLGGTIVRLAPPLAALAWVTTTKGGMREAGAAELLLGFYLILLAATVPLIIMGGEKSPLGGRGNAAN
jgi:hypothetical protein